MTWSDDLLWVKNRQLMGMGVTEMNNILSQVIVSYPYHYYCHWSSYNDEPIVQSVLWWSNNDPIVCLLWYDWYIMIQRIIHNQWLSIKHICALFSQFPITRNTRLLEANDTSPILLQRKCVLSNCVNTIRCYVCIFVIAKVSSHQNGKKTCV